MKKTKRRTAGQIFLRFLFVVYGIAMVWLLFGQRIGTELSYDDYLQRLQSNINLTPLYTIKLYLRILRESNSNALLRHALINLVGNVVMFIPLGIFMPGIFLKKPGFFSTIFTVAAMIIAVELVQLVTLLGSCDVDDLILNLLGAAIGYFLWKFYKK